MLLLLAHAHLSELLLQPEYTVNKNIQKKRKGTDVHDLLFDSGLIVFEFGCTPGSSGLSLGLSDLVLVWFVLVLGILRGIFWDIVVEQKCAAMDIVTVLFDVAGVTALEACWFQFSLCLFEFCCISSSSRLSFRLCDLILSSLLSLAPSSLVAVVAIGVG